MSEPDRPAPGPRPRQARAVATRKRVHDAALAEFARVGVDAARVADIVAAAGVSWGTFFHYFPRKQDVLLESSAHVCAAFAGAIDAGIERADPIEDIVRAAFAAMAAAAPRSPALRAAILREVGSNPGTLTVYLDGRAPTLVPAMAALIAHGQRRGAIRDDEPAAALAAILVYGVLGAARRHHTGPAFDVSTPVYVLAQRIILDGMRTR